MTRKRKLIRNLLILILLIIWINAHVGVSLTPFAAHRRSERSANYGPSTVVKTQRIEGEMFFLCKYDRWFSLNEVKREPLWLWHAGSGVHGQENDPNNPINFGFANGFINNKHEYWKFYGIVNDPAIKSIKLELSMSGASKTLEQKELYDNMFLIIWDEEVQKRFGVTKIIGLDKDSKVVYEKALP